MLLLARGMIAHMHERRRQIHTHPRAQKLTHSSVCHFLISCCSLSLNLFTLCAGSRHCALFLFVMVITLSLTVPHFACQLTFTLFSPFFFSFFGMYCQISWRMFKVYHSPLLEPIILSGLPFYYYIFISRDRSKEVKSGPLFILAASHLF